jgi:hypothetical protein
MSGFSRTPMNTQAAVSGFDVIGDVHGRNTKLIALLKHLGYRNKRGAWRHPSRQAIFVGDLVDRGDEQVATVELVRRMVDAGSAQCILGNHEFNAIAWKTPDPHSPGEYLRLHGKGNHKQHEAFLREVEGKAKHDELIAWFMTLPLWLELPGLRIAHACWHQAAMDKLAPSMGPGATLTQDLILRGSRKECWEYEAIEVICKGPNLDLPPGASYADKDGKVRHEVRLRWWASPGELRTYRDAAVGPSKDMQLIPETPIPLGVEIPQYAGPPVIFGHYWFTGDPAVISKRFACVDFSAAYHGPLVAYRFDGETELQTAKLEWVPSAAHPR